MATKKGDVGPRDSEDTVILQRTERYRKVRLLCGKMMLEGICKDFGLKEILQHKEKEELKRIRDFIKQHGLAKLKEYKEDEEVRRENTPLNIAVIGNSGVGKSTFINTIRGLLPTDKGAAAVGIVQTTLDPTPYPDASSPNLVYWDLAGVGTPQYPVDTYKEQISFHRYDFFLVLSCTQFTANDAWLAVEARRAWKPCIFARTKVDASLRSQREDFPDTYNEEDALKKISRAIQDNLKDCSLDVPVFVISCKLACKCKWNDFPLLREKLLKDFPHLKRSAMVSAMAATGREVILAKYFLLLLENVSRWAALPALVTSLAIQAVDLFVEISRLEKIITYCLKQFGIDRVSLQRLSRQFEIPMSALLQELHTQCGDSTPRNIALEALVLRVRRRSDKRFTPDYYHMFAPPSYFCMSALISELLKNLKDAALNIQGLVWEKCKETPKLPQGSTEIARIAEAEDEKEKTIYQSSIRIGQYKLSESDYIAYEKDYERIIIHAITDLL